MISRALPVQTTKGTMRPFTALELYTNRCIMIIGSQRNPFLCPRLHAAK